MEENKTNGRFVDSLLRKNSQIKKDRATAIIEDAQLIYKRQVEDKKMQLKRLERAREGMLDLAPGTTTDITMPAFDPVDFAQKHHKLSVDIRNLKIEVDVAEEQYKELFGDYETNAGA
jgi:hypothetical protein